MLYLYGLAQSDLLPEIEGTGLDGRSPLFLHRHENIATILSEVAESEFCSDQAEDNLKDLAWIGPRAFIHEQVIEQVMRNSPILPARFGTIFSTLKGVDSLLEKNQDTILTFLDRIKDKQEWAIKGMLDRAAAKEVLFKTALDSQAQALSALPQGKRYFQEQKIRANVEKELKSWLTRVCKNIASALGGCASDFYERKTLSRNTGERNKDMVINWAYLVDNNQLSGFRETIEKINMENKESGLILECSGPWPPYSFCPRLESF